MTITKPPIRSDTTIANPIKTPISFLVILDLPIPRLQRAYSQFSRHMR